MVAMLSSTPEEEDNNDMLENFEDSKELSQFDENSWMYIPDTVLLHIFSYLSASELSGARAVCLRWSRLAMDEMLWKHLLYRDLHIDSHIDKASAETSWYEEYRRLKDDLPIVLTEVNNHHSNQVLHVAFSHDGSMFSTASKDGTIVVWDANKYPCRLKYTHDMKDLCWNHPQFSQFNSSDTLLLVSGIHFGSPHNSSGEIAIFTVQNEFLLQCRVANKPYDVFGCWLGDSHLISSDRKWLAHLTSLTTLWINKASQGTESEHIPVIKQLFRLYNCNASSAKSVMIANDKVRDNAKLTGDVHVEYKLDMLKFDRLDNLTIQYNPEYYAQCNTDELSTLDDSVKAEGSSERESVSEVTDITSEESSECSSISKDQDFIDRKLLIYTCGTATYVPHQVCFKYIENIQFPKHLNPGLPIKERIAARQRERERQDDDGPDWTNYESVKYMFDEPDRVIDVHGYIIGMALSPDHKYLYINVQLWLHSPKEPLTPPPESHKINLYVIDLSTLDVVGSMVRPTRVHCGRGYYVFLDVSKHFVGSGADDNLAYIWERHYGVALAQFQHTDVVNAVAFSPKSDIFVTACDDYSFRVWRSKKAVRRLGLHRMLIRPEGVRLHRQRPCRLCSVPLES